MKLERFVIAAVTSLLFLTQTDAAEFRCEAMWGSDAPAKGEALYDLKEQDLKQRFPSGQRPTATTCRDVLMKGIIDPGDGAKFAAFLHANHPFLDSIDLWSPGGSVEEALKIGRLVRKALLVTIAPASLGRKFGNGFLESPEAATTCVDSGCHCASACFLIWAAGRERSGDVLGLHRPSSRSAAFANLTPERAAELYRQLLADNARYLREMEVPRRYIEITNDTASNDMRWLSESEARSMSEVPSIAEWISAACGPQMDKTQEQALSGLKSKRDRSWEEKIIYEALMKQSVNRYRCEEQKIDNARDAITEVSYQ